MRKQNTQQKKKAVDLSELPRISLHIGGVEVSNKPVILDTVLGSCIAACLFDPEHGIGGMNHFMLPEGLDPDNPTSTRYGVFAMELLINELMQLGVKRTLLKAKIFGGGHVLRVRENLDGVPQRNIDFIKTFLATEKIPTVNEDLGGYQPRRVLFYTQTGKVMLRRLGDNDAERKAQEEINYLNSLKSKKLDGDATLF